MIHLSPMWDGIKKYIRAFEIPRRDDLGNTKLLASGGICLGMDFEGNRRVEQPDSAEDKLHVFLKARVH